MRDRELNLTRADIVDYLTAVDALLGEGAHETVIVVGGAYLALLGLRDASDDIDSALPVSATVARAAHQVAQDRGTAKVWLNDRARAFCPAGLTGAGCQVLLTLPHLLVLGPPADLVFSMKVNASRSHDLTDLALLWPLCSFRTPTDAAAAFADDYPDEKADPYLSSHIARAVGLHC